MNHSGTKVIRKAGDGLDGKVVLFCLAALLVGAEGRSEEAKSAVEAQENPIDQSLEQLLRTQIPTVYGASKHQQKTTEAPASVTIVDADEIRRYGYQTLGDILRSVQGMDISYDRDYQFLGVRGFNRQDYNNRVLLLVDGHRINNAMSDGALIDTGFLLDVDLIEKVEVIRGPGSVLYGNNAVFGVINVVTRKGGDINRVEVSGWGGSLDTGRGRITVGHKFTNDVEFLVSGSYYESAGADRIFFKEFNSPAFNHGLAQNGDFDKFKSVFSSISYHDLTLEGGFISRVKADPTAPFATVDPTNPGYAFAGAFNDPRTLTIDDRSYVNLRLAHKFSENADLTAQVYYDRADHQGFNVFKDPVLVTDIVDSQQLAQSYGAELQLNKRFFERHLFTAGVEYRDDFDLQSQTIDQALGPQKPIVAPRESKGAYFQGDIMLRTNLHFNAGVRYDKYADFDATANPRLALIYDPFERSTFKAIYGTAFRAPNFFELSLQSPSRALQPETITTYELVYEQGFGSHLRSSVAGFYNRMSDLISFLPDPSGVGSSYQNVPGADGRGLEFALDGNWLEGAWPGGLRTRASYTLQKTRDRVTGQLLTDSPENLAKFNLSVPILQERLFASAEFQYTSHRTTLLGTDAGGYGVLNFVLFGQKLAKGLDATVGIYNVLDRQYADPAPAFHVQDVIPQLGRTVMGKITYRF